ncbi:MAG: hypothetical protein WCF16_10840 [Alphaproteobacteria bacterium]
MKTIVIGLVISYVALAILLLAMLLYSRLHWTLKAAAIVLVSVFYPVSYLSLMEILGWPTAQPLPDRFRLVAAQVYEPDKQEGTSGAIYLWVTDVSENAGRVAPRAYLLTYSSKLHTAVEDATKSLRSGVPQIGEMVKDEETGGPGRVPTDTAKMAAVAATNKFDIIFTPLSTTALPEK